MGIRYLWVFHAVGLMLWTMATSLLLGRIDSFRFLVTTTIVSMIFTGNIYHSKSQYNPQPFLIEEKIYVYVERNAGYLMASVTIFFVMVSSKWEMITQNANVEIVVSMSISMICSSLVLALVWMPTDNPRNLVYMRHVKSVLYTWALGAFMFGPVALIQEVISR